MPHRTPGEAIRIWFDEVWNQRRTDLVADLLAPYGVIHATDEEGGDSHGPEEFVAFQQRMLAAFPDIQFTVLDVIEQDDRAAARWSATMTHEGDGLGVPPTGNAAAVTGMSIIRMEDGMAVEGWNEWDRLSLAVACRMVAPQV